MVGERGKTGTSGGVFRAKKSPIPFVEEWGDERQMPRLW